MRTYDEQAEAANGSAPLRLANDASALLARRKEKVQVGDLTPDVTLLDQASRLVSLGDVLGKNHRVLYCSPKNTTALCREEACAFRDSDAGFKEAGADVMGVSSDAMESHRQFAHEHHLPFTLLSDTDGALRKRFGVSTAFGLPGRVTYIKDRQDIVRCIFFSQFPSKRQVDEALETLQKIHEE